MNLRVEIGYLLGMETNRIRKKLDEQGQKKNSDDFQTRYGTSKS